MKKKKKRTYIITIAIPMRDPNQNHCYRKKMNRKKKKIKREQNGTRRKKIEQTN